VTECRCVPICSTCAFDECEGVIPPNLWPGAGSSGATSGSPGGPPDLSGKSERSTSGPTGTRTDLHERRGGADPPNALQSRMAPSRRSRRCPQRRGHALPEALLRLAPHPLGVLGEVGPGAPRTRDGGRGAGHLLQPLARQRRPTRAAVDNALGSRCGTKSPGRSLCDDEWACKRDPVQRLAAPGWPSISAAYPGVALAGGRVTRAPCSALLPAGLIEPSGSPRTLVRSYRTVSPLPVAGGHPSAHRRSALCDTVRQVTPTWLSPALCPVESRLSSTRSSRAAATRPTHRRPSGYCCNCIDRAVDGQRHSS
jgi:hypothetical protein